MALESWDEAASELDHLHGKAEAWRTVPWVLFANYFTSMFNDCEISKPLIQTSERSPPGLLGASQCFKYLEIEKRKERRGILCTIVTIGGPEKAQQKPSFLRKAARQGSSFNPELEVWAWLRVPVGRLKSGGESPPFPTRSRVLVICTCGYTPGRPLSSF